MEGWVEREIEGCEFPDERLKTRFGKLLGQLGKKIGAALPTACQDWAATKAAYRFFDNSRVDESIILAGHFAATNVTHGGCQRTRYSSCTTRPNSAFSVSGPRRSARRGFCQVLALASSRSPSAGCSCIPAWRLPRLASRWG